MRIVVDVSNIMALSISSAVIAVVSTPCDINGIYKSIFTECVGKVPKCFLISSGDEIKPFLTTLAHATDSFAFHLPMEEEAGGDDTIAHQYELSEE